MRIRSKTGLLAFALVASALARAQAQPGAERFQKLPKPWSVSAHVAVPDAQLPAFGQKLGAAIVRLTNTTLVADGQQLKVNIVECKTEDDAAKVQAGFLRLHNNLAATCPREGKSVIEFVAKDLAIIERAYTELGFKAPKVVYEISFRAAPIEKCDYMAWNKLFNAFLAPTRDEGLIRDLSQSFAFGNAIRLRNSGQGADRSTFTFNPLPRESKADASGEITTHTFADLPRSVAVPEVGISAVIASEAFAITPTRRRSGPELTEANSFWPATDPQIVALASKITEGKSTPREKADAVLQWLKPGSNLRYAGDITGSRYGVAAVLKQGYGHCWDFSHCFVTLCRAAGVPCRQVLGWLHGTSGHVWAEVLLEGQGWRQVDPTAGMGCDCRYIPYIASEDGRVPLVYVSRVDIKAMPGR